ncbi:MAG: YraN family protein [Atopobiaceae bacterium]|nr:YraN family protein [Atopobiaceae bacterium]
MSSNDNGNVTTADEEGREPAPVADMTPEEVEAEGLTLARLYLVRRGYEVVDEGFGCADGNLPIVANDDGETVLADVRTSRDLGGGDAVPALAVDGARRSELRRAALLHLAAHPTCNRIRVDVIAISIVGERCARLRHLIGAYSWEE